MNRREQEEAAERWVKSVLDRGATGAGDAAGPERWQATWAALELPPAPPAPPGFALRVGRAREAGWARATAPILGAGWMRAAAFAALLAGIALGSTLSYGSGSVGDGSAASDESWQATSLSEEYLSALSSPETILASPSVGDESTGVGGERPEASEP